MIFSRQFFQQAIRMKALSIHQFGFFLLGFAILSVLTVAQVGCSGSDTAKSTDRESTKTPLFKADLAKSMEAKASRIPASGKRLEFVHADHFGIVSFNIKSIRESQTLEQIDWAELSEMLTQTIGTGDLDRIERVWMLLDRENFTLIPSGDSNENPLVLVIDQIDDIDLETTAAQIRKTLPAKLTVEKVDLAVGELTRVSELKSVYVQSSKRMMVGSHEMLAKLKDNSNSNQSLVDRFYQLDDTFVSGVVDVTAVRSQIQTIFGMVGSFGPMKDYAKLPESLRRIEFQANLDSKELMLLNVEITDKPLARLIANSIQSSGGANESSFPAGMGGMFGGGIPGMQEMPRTMFELKTMAAVQTISDEIEDKQLMSVRLKDDFVRLKLGRPESLDNLVGAMIQDQLHSAQLTSRLEQARAIAIALEAYEKKFDRLPPAGLITAEQANENQRAQFNWLTGILPEIGEQELYDQFDFSKPFDSEPNLELAKQMPAAFGNQDSDDASGMTAFQVLGGEGIWGDGEAGPEIKLVQDRKFGTAILGEGKTKGTWTDPSVGLWEVGEVESDSLGQSDEDGWIIVTANFKVRIASKEEDKSVSAIISPAGGEKVTSAGFIPTNGLIEPE